MNKEKKVKGIPLSDVLNELFFSKLTDRELKEFYENLSNKQEDESEEQNDKRRSY